MIIARVLYLLSLFVYLNLLLRKSNDRTNQYMHYKREYYSYESYEVIIPFYAYVLNF